MRHVSNLALNMPARERTTTRWWNANRTWQWRRAAWTTALVAAPVVLGVAALLALVVSPTAATAARGHRYSRQVAKARPAPAARACRQAPLWWQKATARRGRMVAGGAPTQIINTRATWYGPGFHGRRTASGERFNQQAMTLASRHLPFGTRVRVVNPRTGKAAIARVNDRGPYRSGYTADLSKGLAGRIGLLSSGPVRLEILAK